MIRGRMAMLFALLLLSVSAATAVAQTQPDAGFSTNVLFDGRPGSRFFAAVDRQGLLLDLPGFSFFQELTSLPNQANHVRFIQTDDGEILAPALGARFGWMLGDLFGPSGRLRIEAQGLYSERTRSSDQILTDPAATEFGWIDIDGANGVGTDTGDTLITSTSRRVGLGSGNLLVKYDRPISDRLVLSPYLGFSTLHIDQRFNVGGRFTNSGISTNDTLNLREELIGRYYGGVIGMETLIAVGQWTTLSCDAGWAVYDFQASRDARQVDAGPNIPDRDIRLSQQTGRTANAAHLRMQLTRQFRWMHVGLFGSVQYLDAVPCVQYSPGPGAANLPTAPSRLAIGEAWGFGGGLQLMMPF